MRKIFENEYLIFEVHDDKRIFVYTWKSTSEDLSIEAFFIEVQIILTEILNNNYDYIIGNNINFHVIVQPETQKKINEQVLQQINNKIKTFIHICNDDLINQLVVEQIFEENANRTYTEHFVRSIDEALGLVKD